MGLPLAQYPYGADTVEQFEPEISIFPVIPSLQHPKIEPHLKVEQLVPDASERGVVVSRQHP